MKIVIVTDAWVPQVNGVVRTLQSIAAELGVMGHDVAFVAPDRFRSMPCPTYPEIRLALAFADRVGRIIADHAPDAVHIATEGPLGLAARRWCLRQSVEFTTAYHTQFPDYVARRTGVPAAWIWRYIRWFHAPSSAVLASTPTIRRVLEAHGLANVRHWGRGVDLALFRPDAIVPPTFDRLPRPIMLYVGRVAVEKNIEAFLAVDRPGSKIVVGDGPLLAELKRKHPAVAFLGALSGEALAGVYAGADVFVFPSRTDTFGLVMIEALACGTPVAAFPVTGPVDVLDPRSGAMAEDLGDAIAAALMLDRADAAAYGCSFGWRASAQQFLAALVPARRAAAAA
ncbi:Glycosyltransferase involved in cell wall bisynthesis [Sphingomonas laterariae]|uniref:Glycosyltransferase involved in cell wall bisynthesis n=1 Tax=Edaphosphingomonas laterariae TaxID=861865 RepID=A0A239CE10_9SPHN|nr:glycosyltransferase family 1 protein [Sphingomonas laterariae]SNS18465.1 Glycosyltransferase involved in cell wall bisynthesis [Sphingomonas laterariae]